MISILWTLGNAIIATDTTAWSIKRVWCQFWQIRTIQGPKTATEHWSMWKVDTRYIIRGERFRFYTLIQFILSSIWYRLVKPFGNSILEIRRLMKICSSTFMNTCPISTLYMVLIVVLNGMWLSQKAIPITHGMVFFCYLALVIR